MNSFQIVNKNTKIYKLVHTIFITDRGKRQNIVKITLRSNNLHINNTNKT